MTRGRSKAVRIAGSHVITTCATIAAILLFVAIGSQIIPAAIFGVPPAGLRGHAPGRLPAQYRHHPVRLAAVEGSEGCARRL